ncbi:hypothetical protein pdam_00009679 [Pocillopora damicornis]|uniref:Amino acid permease/ SLC12A domain-containing protein n=1 Tax=Pocillopora damicornis TaxID=46731 RepID=A0A3M6UAT8_POCDA|nr:hypothetical protein pdam_00009679 [Pocillopora damicornis]
MTIKIRRVQMTVGYDASRSPRILDFRYPLTLTKAAVQDRPVHYDKANLQNSRNFDDNTAEISHCHHFSQPFYLIDMSDEVEKKLDVENSNSNPEESPKDQAAGDDESTEQKKKFSVLKVKFGSDSSGDTSGEHSNESSSPSSPIESPRSPEHFTHGYATNEAIPMTIFYRSQHSHGHGGKQRPTLQQLRKGLENDKAEFTEETAPLDDSKLEDGQDSIEIRNVKSAPKFGWIKGVLFGCLLNIWGVMLYLRLSWVVGQAGIALASLIVIMSAVVTTLTTLSLSAVCTNGEVKGDESNDIRIVGLITVVILLGITMIGLEWVVRAQMLLLIVLVISILNVLIGTFIGPQSEESRSRGFVGYQKEVFETNLGPGYKGESFFSVFAVFFPAATGILAGVNISGDLKDVHKAVPKGTLLAILISTIVYVMLAWFVGGCVEREALGFVQEVLQNKTLASCVEQECRYGLLNDFQVMEEVSGWGPIVTAGIFASTLSSALASLVGAPKAFQAVCKDKLFPYIDFFGVGLVKSTYLYNVSTVNIVNSAAHQLIRNIIAIHSKAPNSDTHML